MNNSDSDFTLLVQAILHEILSALKRLLETGEEHTIFIDKLGLSLAERQAIRDVLGVGGVKIKYDSTDEPAEWLESNIAGVWHGVFRNHNQNPFLETIEICKFPQVPASQPEDIKNGCSLLNERLETLKKFES